MLRGVRGSCFQDVPTDRAHGNKAETREDKLPTQNLFFFSKARKRKNSLLFRIDRTHTSTHAPCPAADVATDRKTAALANPVNEAVAVPPAMLPSVLVLACWYQLRDSGPAEAGGAAQCFKKNKGDRGSVNRSLPLAKTQLSTVSQQPPRRGAVDSLSLPSGVLLPLHFIVPGTRWIAFSTRVRFVCDSSIFIGIGLAGFSGLYFFKAAARSSIKRNSCPSLTARPSTTQHALQPSSIGDENHWSSSLPTNHRAVQQQVT